MFLIIINGQKLYMDDASLWRSSGGSYMFLNANSIT